jgi:hypothetical protein
MGEKFTVTAPVAEFNGDVAGLVFRAGEAVADGDADARALAYCRRHGYTVTPTSKKTTATKAAASTPAAEPGGGEPTQPKGNASKAEWVAYAVAQGADHDEADAMTRDDLAAKYGKDS